MSYQGSPFSPSSAATLRFWRISIRIRRPFLSVRGGDALGVEAFRLDGAVLSAIENIEVPLLAAALSVGIVDSFEEQISGIRCTVSWSTLGMIVGFASPPSFLPARPSPAEALGYG